MKQRPIYGKEPEKTHSTPTDTSLDEQISNLTVKTTKGLEKHWKLVAGIAVAALALVAGFQAIEAWGARGEDRLQARLWQLTDGRGEKDAPDIAAMQALLDDAQGSKGERLAYQQVVSSLEAYAAGLSATNPYPGVNDDRTDAEKAADEKKSLECLQEAAKIAAAGAERFPADGEMKTWAEKVRKRVDAEVDSSWLPEKRSFRLRSPTTGAAASVPSDAAKADSAATPAPETPSPPAGDGATPPAEGAKTSGAETPGE